MNRIELRPAYVWDCDHCGRENFVSCRVAEMSDEEQAELREEMGVEAFEEGAWCLMPESVTCDHCGAKFETQHFKEGYGG